jgi:hypothetical protein
MDDRGVEPADLMERAMPDLPIAASPSTILCTVWAEAYFGFAY